MQHPIVLVYRSNPDLTREAVADCLAQTLDVRLLLINNGGPDLDTADARVYAWRHDPPLPSLSATWNRALQFAWEAGAEHALVVNNDVRLWQGTYEYLVKVQAATDALFVTATGVTADQYRTFLETVAWVGATERPAYPLPGPDFSCYLITRECHERYPFDESYVPAFCEDLDLHRRMMLGGDGARVFGTGLPYLHYGSQTIKSLPDEARARLSQQISAGSRVHHAQKWGGGANEETYTVPFAPASQRFGVTTAELFERVRNGQDALEEETGV